MFIVMKYSDTKFVWVILSLLVCEFGMLLFSLIIAVMFQRKLINGTYDPHYDTLNQCFLFLIFVLYGVTSYAFMFYKKHDTLQPIIHINTASMLSVVVTLGFITLTTMYRNLLYFTADG